MSLLRPPFSDFLKVGSVAIEENPKPGETATRRNARTKESLVTQPADGVDTIVDVLRFAERKHGKKNAIGWRDIIKVHDEEKEVKKTVNGQEVTEKKIWKYFELSPYKYMSFTELVEAVDEVAVGLINIGLEKGSTFNIYAQTRYVEYFKIYILMPPILFQSQLATDVLRLCINLGSHSYGL